MKPFSTIQPHVVSRDFAASRNLLWKVNTQAEHIAQWLSPAGFTTTVKTYEFKIGGINHYCQTAADGKTIMWGKSTFIEIDPKDRIVTIHGFSDENGGFTSHPMAPTWPKLMHSVFTFEDLGPKRSRLTVAWTPVEGSSTEELNTFDAARSGMDQGWKGTLDKLESYLATVK